MAHDGGDDGDRLIGPGPAGRHAFTEERRAGSCSGTAAAHVDAVRRHLSSVREAVSVPAMLSHVPATTHVELPVEVSRELVDADVIHAVKQSFYDAYHTWDAKIALGDDAAGANCRDARGAPHWLELMHGAANMLGHDVGLPRPPFAELAEADRDRLAAIMHQIGEPG